ncbi:unnamed protein product [Amoebophrya sp. A25]|nr:unnamed protein product [Amoebophrya sp. A25]|eukprot:GSA25T00013961001.1
MSVPYFSSRARLAVTRLSTAQPSSRGFRKSLSAFSCAVLATNTFTSLVSGKRAASKSMAWFATTIDNTEGADRIKNAVRKLSGSGEAKTIDVHIRHVYSYFWWDGKLDEAAEQRLEVSVDEKNSEGTAPLVEQTIVREHSDDVPMLLSKRGWNEMPSFPCYQLTFRKSLDDKESADEAVRQLDLQKAGREVVSRRQAGCAQFERERQTLFVKTTAQRKEEAKKTIADMPGGTKLHVEETLVNANEDYWKWLEEQTESGSFSVSGADSKEKKDDESVENSKEETTREL